MAIWLAFICGLFSFVRIVIVGRLLLFMSLVNVASSVVFAALVVAQLRLLARPRVQLLWRYERFKAVLAAVIVLGIVAGGSVHFHRTTGADPSLLNCGVRRTACSAMRRHRVTVMRQYGTMAPVDDPTFVGLARQITHACFEERPFVIGAPALDDVRYDARDINQVASSPVVICLDSIRAFDYVADLAGKVTREGVHLIFVINDADAAWVLVKRALAGTGAAVVAV